MTLTSCLPAMLVMMGVTYLIRMLPLALVRGKLRSRYLRSLLYYIPFAVLSAMTFPAIFASTADGFSSLAGALTGILLALCDRSLITVALFSSLAAYLASLLPSLPF